MKIKFYDYIYIFLIYDTFICLLFYTKYTLYILFNSQ